MNFDFTGSIQRAPEALCRYVKMQKAVSEYYKEKIGMEQGLGQGQQTGQGRSCICYNMCYLEGTNDEVRDVDGGDIQCQCYNANYTGQLDPSLAKPIDVKVVSPAEVMEFLRKIDKRLTQVEEYIVVKEGGKKE